MAADQDIARTMGDYLRANGYTCGRLYAHISDVARDISANLPGETPQTLEPKIRRIAASPSYGFKVRADSVSAPDASDPDCGRG